MKKNSDNPNEALLQDIYSSSKMGVESIAKLLPKVQNQAFKNTLSSLLSSYQGFATDATTRLTQMNVVPKDATFMQKLPAEFGIAMETAMDNSDSKIAELMINGSVMGITDMKKSIASNNSVQPDTVTLAQNVIAFHEQNINDLTQYL